MNIYEYKGDCIHFYFNNTTLQSCLYRLFVQCCCKRFRRRIKVGCILGEGNSKTNRIEIEHEYQLIGYGKKSHP